MFTNYYGQTRQQYRLCKELIDRENRKVLRLVFTISLCIYGVLAVLSSFYDRIARLREIYMGAVALLIIFIITVHGCKRLKNRVELQVYVLISILFLISMRISVSIPDQKATVFPVLLILLPLFFIDKQIRMTIYLLVMCAIYSVAVVYYKRDIEAYYDVFCIYTYFVLTVIAHYNFNVKMVGSIMTEWKMSERLVQYEVVHGTLKKRAEIDALTGVYNRETFIELANAKIREAKETNVLLLLGILDIDHFKQINDMFGHQMGDWALQMVGKGLRGCIRNGDIVGRLGGDEFVFLLDQVKDLEHVQSIMDRIFHSASSMPLDEERYIQVSIGVTLLREEDQRFSELYTRADMALYTVKEQGRNSYYIYR